MHRAATVRERVGDMMPMQEHPLADACGAEAGV